MQEWRKRQDSVSGTPPSDLAPELALDLRWSDGGEFLGVLARDVVAWEDITHWRISAISSHESEGRARQFIDEAALRLQARSKAEPTDPRERVTSRLKKILSAVKDRDRRIPEGLVGMLLNASGHTGGPDCPACKRFQEADSLMHPEDEGEIEMMRSLVKETPELMRWARLIAGSVMMSTINQMETKIGTQEARIHATAMMTGNMDLDPHIEGAIDSLAVLLRDDVDFAEFRRQKLVGRAPGVNDRLHNLEQTARSRVRVVEVRPGDSDFPTGRKPTKH